MRGRGKGLLNLIAIFTPIAGKLNPGLVSGVLRVLSLSCNYAGYDMPSLCLCGFTGRP